jgi:lactoylglutathione lyase
MKIDHLAIWVHNLEGMKDFYEKYFQAISGEKYINVKKNFTSYFLSFESGCRLELMQMPGIPETQNDRHKQFMGFIHFAIAVESRQRVDNLTEQLRSAGFEIVGEPRTTGDGYYESVVLDPEGNRLEITV